jgi:hypothetical protein
MTDLMASWRHRLFPQGGVSATLGLTGTRTLDSGVVSLTYVPAAQDARPADEDLSDT